MDKQRVIQEVMLKHGILLSKDDPILAFLAVHDVLFDNYTQRLKNSITDVNENMESVIIKHTDLSQALSERLVGNAVNELQQQSRQMQSSLKTVMQEEENRLVSRLSAIAEQTERNRKLSFYSLIACCVLLAVNLLLFALPI